MAQTSAPDDFLVMQMAKAHKCLESRISDMLEKHHASMLGSIERMTEGQPLVNDASANTTASPSKASSLAPARACASAPYLAPSPAPSPAPWMPSRSDGADSRSEINAMRPVDSVRTDDGMRARAMTLKDAKTRLGNIKHSIIQGASGASHSFSSTPEGARAGGCRGRILAFASAVRNRREFEAVVTVMILASAISVGVHADWSIKHPGMDLPEGAVILDRCFLAAFALELVIRILAEGPMFFHTRNELFGWNVFDTTIVVVTFLNEVNPLALNLSMMRAVRPLRLVKVLRVLRFLALFRELRIMVSGILNCGMTLCWSLILLSVLSYIYAVFCLQIFADWLGSVDESALDSDDKLQRTVDAISYNFYSLPWCAYTLFKAISGGVEWGEALADHMYTVSALMVISFVLYILATVFCVLNVITAQFVDAATRRSIDDDADVVEQIDGKARWVEKLVTLFERHDLEGDGYLSLTEFLGVAQDWRARSLFKEIGLDLDFQCSKALFRILDIDGDGLIDIDEFVHGCFSLKGPAQSLDMYLGFRRLSKRIDDGLGRKQSQAGGKQPGPRRLPDADAPDSSVPVAMRCASAPVHDLAPRLSASPVRSRTASAEAEDARRISGASCGEANGSEAAAPAGA